MQETYKLQRDVDGVVWVSIQPLMDDIRDALKKITDLDDPRMIEVDHKELNLKILGLQSIYTFLGALMTEQTLVEKKDRLNKGPEIASEVKIVDIKETLH